MKTFGISRMVITTCIFAVILFHDISAQGNCSLDICGETNCESVTAAFNLLNGASSFCENTIVYLANESPDDFSYFIVDWTDGSIDTVFGDTLTHLYSYENDSIRCVDGNEAFQVCIQAIVECSEGISCAWVSYGLIMRPKPVAKMTVASEHCVFSSVTFQNNSCNSDEYLWQFGDGEMSIESNPVHVYTSPGLYTVLLIVYNECGTDTVTRAINITSSPNLNVSYNEGIITAIAEGGVAPFLFTLTPGDLMNDSGIFTDVEVGLIYTVFVTDINGCSDSVQLLTTAVSNIQRWEIEISPNPSKGQLIITQKGTGDQNLNLSIIDINGNVIRKFNWDSSLTQMNMEDLPLGVYLMHVNNGSETITKRLVIL